jgi:hypothetical protein
MGVLRRIVSIPVRVWRWLGSRRGRLILVTLVPLVVVLLIPQMLGWTTIDEVFTVVPPHRLGLEAAHELTDLSKDLSALAAGVLAAIVFMLREVTGDQRTRLLIKQVMVTAFFAMVSIYSCIRLRFAVTQQLWKDRLDLSRLEILLGSQTISLLIALSLLMLVAASIYIPRGSEDQRP